MAANQQILVLSLLAITCALALAFEPSPLQDFCVADPSSQGDLTIYNNLNVSIELNLLEFKNK